MELAALTLAAIALLALRWLWDLWRHPYARCVACGGSGRNRGSTRNRYGYCARCDGSGRRGRVGAKMVRRELRK